eukprot:COSAG02_NODE_49982_length_323_cov_0.928571_1_plen_33_part_10
MRSSKSSTDAGVCNCAVGPGASSLGFVAMTATA